MKITAVVDMNCTIRSVRGVSDVEVQYSIRHKSVTSLKQKFHLCSAPELIAIQCFAWNEEVCTLKPQKTLLGSAKRMRKWVGHVAQATKIRNKCEI